MAEHIVPGEEIPNDDEHLPVKHQNEKKTIEAGIVYLSRIPPLMNVKKIRHIFSEFGEVDRIFLQPDEKAPNTKRGRSFTEGWIEFKNKKIAKNVALSLNNSQIGGKKRSRWHDELWNIKYLSRFKWGHLNERLAYEKAVHQQRMRTEISQVKREANFHMQNIEKKLKMKHIEERKRKKGITIPEETESKHFINIRLKETEEEILERKKQKLNDNVKNKKRETKENCFE
ncbi:hypothetical protein ScPMuIL_009082 [Solemya velum]